MKIIKWISALIVIVFISIIGFYLYIGNMFKSSVVEGTIKFSEFVVEDKNKTITIYNEDSIRAVFDTLPFSIYIDELDKDTLGVKIIW